MDSSHSASQSVASKNKSQLAKQIELGILGESQNKFEKSLENENDPTDECPITVN